MRFYHSQTFIRFMKDKTQENVWGKCPSSRVWKTKPSWMCEGNALHQGYERQNPVECVREVSFIRCMRDKTRVNG